MSDIDLQKIYSGKVRDLYAIDDKRMLNRTEMRKFGVRLGDVTVSFTKP